MHIYALHSLVELIPIDWTPSFSGKKENKKDVNYVVLKKSKIVKWNLKNTKILLWICTQSEFYALILFQRNWDWSTKVWKRLSTLNHNFLKIRNCPLTPPPAIKRYDEKFFKFCFCLPSCILLNGLINCVWECVKLSWHSIKSDTPSAPFWQPFPNAISSWRPFLNFSN